MTGRVLAGGLAVAAAFAAGAGACGNGDESSEKTGSSGVADPADGCIVGGDAGESGYPAASDLPSGACDDTTKACESVVTVPCGGCGTTTLGTGQCSCVSGTWSCALELSKSACPACAEDAAAE